MDWYYSSNETQHGPVTEEELKGKISSGEVSDKDLAWCEGMGDWKPVGTIAQFQSGSVAPTPMGAPSPAAASPTPGVQPMGQPVQMAKTSGMAIASLVCGLVGIAGFFACIFPCVVGVGGVIFGHLALREIKKSGDQIAGKGLAIGGLVTGYISTLIFVGFIVLFVFVGLASDSSSDYDYMDESILETEEVDFIR